MIGYYDLSLSIYLYIYIFNIYHVYVQFLYPAAILLGFIVVEIVFGLYFTIELYCRTLASTTADGCEKCFLQQLNWLRLHISYSKLSSSEPRWLAGQNTLGASIEICTTIASRNGLCSQHLPTTSSDWNIFVKGFILQDIKFMCI